MKSALTPYQSQYVAWLLSRRAGAGSAEMLATTLVDARIELNPHWGHDDDSLNVANLPMTRKVAAAQTQNDLFDGAVGS